MNFKISSTQIVGITLIYCCHGNVRAILGVTESVVLQKNLLFPKIYPDDSHLGESGDYTEMRKFLLSQ